MDKEKIDELKIIPSAVIPAIPTPEPEPVKPAVPEPVKPAVPTSEPEKTIIPEKDEKNTSDKFDKLMEMNTKLIETNQKLLETTTSLMKYGGKIKTTASIEMSDSDYAKMLIDEVDD